ncbi:hypothetical protein DPX16_20214 [Anabarilius grahami]|uniref:Uncharacterized protein n=1 Tax=Anabarilius grahami TaxID=495550 RepID=A0A3N0XE63_ANAGA|nr:hypothetical protein DPX16_20214 [Anabarilius grahami]
MVLWSCGSPYTFGVSSSPKIPSCPKFKVPKTRASKLIPLTYTAKEAVPELPAPPWSPEQPAPPWFPELPTLPYTAKEAVPELPAPPWFPKLSVLLFVYALNSWPQEKCCSLNIKCRGHEKLPAANCQPPTILFTDKQPEPTSDTDPEPATKSMSELTSEHNFAPEPEPSSVSEHV